jgi:hypothetical protein
VRKNDKADAVHRDDDLLHVGNEHPPSETEHAEQWEKKAV